MSWKTNIQLVDLDSSQKLEVTCKKCGSSRYLNAFLLSSKEDMAFDYIDEVERKTVCQIRGCGGDVRLALISHGDTEGFTGGLT